MNCNFSEEEWQNMLAGLFNRFPSFQKDGSSAYKPGVSHVTFFDQMAGHPHRSFKTIHVAGTNGKGSVCNMLASVLAAAGLKVGLYTSPHILDFRERMRIRCGEDLYYISKQEVWDFVGKWKPTFEHLDMSFFEITTMMAFNWFREQQVDIAVIETGLGGRLDTTNIIRPELSVITNIGLDHCNILGNSLGEIAFEKAGIIKPCVPVVVGESHPETDPVFSRKTLYSNLPETEFMGDRNRIMSLLTFADKVEPEGWKDAPALLASMDLQGSYQEKNLRTVLACLDVLRSRNVLGAGMSAASPAVQEAIVHTAQRMEFHGRWEKLSDQPYILCDIGHNAHGMKYNFSQLEEMRTSGRFTSLIIVYGSVSDKDLDAVLTLMPEAAWHVFTQADNHRAQSAEIVKDHYEAIYRSRHGVLPENDIVCASVAEAVACAERIASEKGGETPLIYVGGSTYVVSEAVDFLKK